jgi:hypothetical protein
LTLIFSTALFHALNVGSNSIFQLFPTERLFLCGQKSSGTLYKSDRNGNVTFNQFSEKGTAPLGYEQTGRGMGV